MSDLAAVEAGPVFDCDFRLCTFLSCVAFGQAVGAGRVCLAACWSLSFWSRSALATSFAFPGRELASDEGVQFLFRCATLGQSCYLSASSKLGVVCGCAFVAAFQQVVLAGR